MKTHGLRELDLSSDTPCDGPCNGFGDIVLVGLSDDELKGWSERFPTYGKFTRGRQLCPVCRGSKVKKLDDLELEVK